jgi:hypothetical protein
MQCNTVDAVESAAHHECCGISHYAELGQLPFAMHRLRKNWEGSKPEDRKNYSYILDNIRQRDDNAVPSSHPGTREATSHCLYFAAKRSISPTYFYTARVPAHYGSFFIETVYAIYDERGERLIRPITTLPI